MLLTIILSTTDIIRLPIASISLFRVSFILTFLLSIGYIIIKGSIRKNNTTLFVVLILVSSPLAFIISTNKEWATSFLLNDIMGALLIFLVVEFFTLNDLKRLQKAFIQSQYITIFLSVYSYYYHYFLNGLPRSFSFFSFFTIDISEEFIRRASIFGQLRLALPYATPPHLSIIMVIALAILVINKDLFSRTFRYFLLASFGLILISTYSRTGIVAGIIVFLVDLMSKRKINIKKVVIGLLVLLSLVVIFMNVNSTNLDKFANRFVINDLLEDRHLLVPVEGILIWLSSVKNFFFGIGYGSSINIQGRFTFLPPHFLNSYVTLIAEKGLLGFTMVSVLLIRSFRLNILKKKMYFNKNVLSLYYSYGIILASFLFYEAKQNISVWIIVSIVFLVTSYQDSNSLRKRGKISEIQE